MRYKFIIIFCLLIFTSCSNENEQKQSHKTLNKKEQGGREIIRAGSSGQYMGKPGQLLIVSENAIYIDEIAHVFDSVFSKSIRPYYPPTPYFDCYHRTPEEFKKRFTRVRNVIELKIDENIEKGDPKMFIYDGYHAKTQLYTKLEAHDIRDLYDLLEQEIDYLFKIYDDQEWKREFYRHSRYENEQTRKSLKNKFGIDLILPGKFRYESIDNNYAIIIFPERSRQMDLKISSGSIAKANYIQSGIMVWQIPYKDTLLKNPDLLMQNRDTILKKYAKHEMKGVYMGTQYHPAVIPVHEKIKIGDVEGYQFKGLYKFTGEAEPSGGRFWSFHFKHPHRNTIVAVSGYFDVPPTVIPHFEINQVRAVIYSLKAIK